MRRQEEGEPVDAFVTDLYSLAEHCDFNDLHDQLIRDRIVVGIRDSKLSEKLQLDSELTLEKAITKVRQSETVHAQQTVLRGDESKESKSGPIGGVHAQKKHPASTKKAPPKKSNCSRCGKQGARQERLYAESARKEAIFKLSVKQQKLLEYTTTGRKLFWVLSMMTVVIHGILR